MLQTLYTIIFLIPSLVYRRRQCVGNKCVLVCARVGLFVLSRKPAKLKRPGTKTIKRLYCPEVVLSNKKITWSTGTTIAIFY